MEDLEILLSFVAGLIYVIFSAIRKHKANPPAAPDGEEVVWPAPAGTDWPKEASVSSPLPSKATLPPTRPYRRPSSLVLKDTRLPSKPKPTKLYQLPNPANRLGHVLGRYGRLKKAIIASELLQPKSFY